MRKSKPSSRRPNPYLVGGYIAILAIITILLYLPSQGIVCPSGIPKDVTIRPDTWMSYFGPKATKFRLINVTALEAIRLHESALPRQVLVDITKPLLRVTIGNVKFVLEIEYEQPERFVTVNILRLREGHLPRIRDALQNTEVKSIATVSGIPIYAVDPASQSDQGASGPAFIALKETDLIYAERGPVALRMLEVTLNARESGRTFLDDEMLRDGARLSSYLVGDRLGLSLTIFRDPLEGANSIWRTIVVRGSDFVDLRVAGYDTPSRASAEINSARVVLFDSDSKVCPTENYLVSVKRREVISPDDIRDLIAGL